MDLIFIGDSFYRESGTLMSSLYGKDGSRQDWGFVQVALEAGDSVKIRPATETEKAYYQGRLDELKKYREIKERK